jgi:Zn-dependent protease
VPATVPAPPPIRPPDAPAPGLARTPARGTIPVGRLAGIPVGIQPLWLVIVGLMTWSLGAQYLPSEAPGLGAAAAYGLALASVLLLFAGILAHELAHAVVARRNGVRVQEIDLWLLGGVARLRDEPASPGVELRFAAAGPLVTAALAVVFGALRLAIGDAGPDWLRAAVDYQVLVNAAIFGFNVLPAFPLDGGRILRALLWARRADRAGATATAGAVGRRLGWLLVVLGLVALAGGTPAGIWTALIGGFLVVAAPTGEDGRPLGGR